MPTTEKVKPEEIRESNAPLLVCAYEDEQKCEQIDIEGALTLQEFRSRLGDISKDERIVFY